MYRKSSATEKMPIVVYIAKKYNIKCILPVTIIMFTINLFFEEVECFSVIKRNLITNSKTRILTYQNNVIYLQ
jgi:hypothetical protein